jgi:hypothetical protein
MTLSKLFTFAEFSPSQSYSHASDRLRRENLIQTFSSPRPMALDKHQNPVSKAANITL